MTKEQLFTLLAEHGQDHLLAGWDQLDAKQRQSLSAELRDIDFGQIAKLYQNIDSADDIRHLADRATAAPAFELDGPDNRFTPEQARTRGEEALRAGEVGVILVAGGQGTRLGFDHPKGMFPIGPVSNHSLFQIHLEKMIAAARRHGRPIPLALMTSPATHRETVAYFDRNDRFGLSAGDFHVFCQGTMPAVDEASGKILLAAPDRLALSPDGHGGMLAAISGNGLLYELHGRGIKHLFYFQVDNPLVDIAGPEFLGYHLLSDSELSSQVIRKQTPGDKVGNVVLVDGRLRVIEYSDLPLDVAERRNEDGSLAIWGGSIAVHVMDVAFLKRMAATSDGLPFHVARKKVPFVDSDGKRIEPEEPNAIKFERFIFDLLPSAANAIVVEVDTARAFGPLKNASGAAIDTPESVKAQLVRSHTEWLEQAGVEVADGVDVEISPLFALDVVELASKVENGTRINAAKYFG